MPRRVLADTIDARRAAYQPKLYRAPAPRVSVTSMSSASSATASHKSIDVLSRVTAMWAIRAAAQIVSTVSNTGPGVKCRYDGVLETRFGSRSRHTIAAEDNKTDSATEAAIARTPCRRAQRLSIGGCDLAASAR